MVALPSGSKTVELKDPLPTANMERGDITIDIIARNKIS
jgi:hypothetical protein